MDQFQKQLNDMAAQITNLEKLVKSFQDPSAMPMELEKSIQKRIIKVSTKAISDTTITLGGSPAGVIVAKPPDGFIKLKSGQNIPFYND